jgi:hypothetical protein
MRLFLSVATICTMFAACGGSPSSPTPSIPTISGQWTGSYTVISCTETSAAVGACAGIGAGGPHNLTPSQTGGNFVGQLGVGVFAIPISGSVDATGTVTLAGSGPVSFATLTVTSWRAVITGSTMTGTMSYSVSAGSGIALVTATTSLTR